MKKVLRLTESELIGLVNKVINEKKEKKGQQRREPILRREGDNIQLAFGNQSDIDMVMNDIPENIKFLSFMDCDGFVDFSSIDICELPKIMFVYLRGTKNNFEELFDCYEKLSHDMYDLEKPTPPPPPYFKDDRLSDVPEPTFSMNESDLKRLVKKIIK